MSVTPALSRLARAIAVAETTSPLYVTRLPLILESRANARGYSLAHAKRHRVHRLAGKLALAAVGIGWAKFIGAQTMVVRIVREAPRALDDDNLARSAKSLRDGIADALGVDDRDERVVWLVDQAKAKVPSVLIEIYGMKEAT